MNRSTTTPPVCAASTIGCVLVLYHPEVTVLDTIHRLAAQGYPVCVVINAADSMLVENIKQTKGVSLLQNPRNIGLGAALNQGITCAFENPGVSFVTLFDQDSLPDVNLPATLATELLAIDDASNGCIGPCLQDQKAMNLAVLAPAASIATENVLTLPTSGTVIPRSVYAQVGPMKAEFFIDAIDHEWCFRAKDAGLKIWRSCRTSMIHNMGDLAVNWFGQFKPVHHSPLRHYYIVRNHLYLVMRGPAPATWRCREILKLLRRIAVYPFVSKSPLESARLVLWAVYDGLLGQLGECRHVQ